MEYKRKPEKMIITAFLIQTVLALTFAKPYEREKYPGRAMTWSGWMPGSGMSVFASSEDPWAQQYGGLKPPPMGDGWGFEEPNFDKTPQITPYDQEKPKKTSEDDEKQHKPIKPFQSKPRKNYDEEDDDRRYSGSNANASFNAWFPIMLGMYPEQKSRGSERNSESRNDDGSVAAIANSVNHGRSGVASSHAIVYSGQPPNEHNFKKF